MNANSIKKGLQQKWSFIAVGLINVFLFHYAIYRLWFFLYNPATKQTGFTGPLGYCVNMGLILFFSVPHSLLLTTRVKKWVLKFIPQKLYSTFYSLHACFGIFLLDNYWSTLSSNLVVWGPFQMKIIQGLYALSWIFMFWAMYATGLFRQSGIEEWWCAIMNKKMQHSLIKEGPYHVCRHPIYAAFLGMIWFTPYMTSDRLLLAVLWSIYIFMGASFKERRLRKNKKYKEYSERVPAFPFVPQNIDNILTKKIWRQV